MNDLVSKASTAYINAYGKTLMTFDERHLEAMTAAAKVLLEAALGEPTHGERLQFRKGVLNHEWVRDLSDATLTEFIANRKARLLAPKTIEERVTIDELANTIQVWLDRNVQCTFCTRKNAETFRRGLIAEMREMG